jgi:ParB family chromosome partitioning protein
MRFDLEALSLPAPAGDEVDRRLFEPPAEASRADGQPLLLAIDTIDEDPDQPRHEFDAESLQELASTIAEFGVRQPISVREHPAAPGRWLLNFGCRRLRASRLAGRTEIPAFVEQAVDSYVKVIENEQRAGLTPLELAMFIQQRLALGESQADIARRLGKGRAYVTFAMALIDAPDWLMTAYREGRCRGLRALYELRRAGMPDCDVKPVGKAEYADKTHSASILADARAEGSAPTGTSKPDPDSAISETAATQQQSVSVPATTRLVVTVEIDGEPMELVLDRLPADPMTVHVKAVGDDDLKTVSIESLNLIGLARR